MRRIWKMFRRRRLPPDVYDLIKQGEMLMNIIAQFKAKLAGKIAELRAEKAASNAKDETIAGLQGAIRDKNNEIFDLKASIQSLNPEKLNAKIAELQAQVADYEKAFADAMGEMDAPAPIGGSMEGFDPPVGGSMEGMDR